MFPQAPTPVHVTLTVKLKYSFCVTLVFVVGVINEMFNVPEEVVNVNLTNLLVDKLVTLVAPL